MARWYLAFAAFASAVAVASGQPIERCWGAWAAIGYVAAARGSRAGWRFAATAALTAVAAMAAAAFAWWLARRPPRTARDATVLLAVALTAAVTLAPATRWGYCAYPLALLGWLRLSRPAESRSYSSERTLATPSASACSSSGAAAAPASG